MARDYYCQGEVMVNVKGMTGTVIEDYTQLGLADKQIKMLFNLEHQQILVNDYGTKVPAAIMTDLIDAYIEMTLVHFDRSVLEFCWGESQGGWNEDQTGNLQGSGVILDGGVARFESGWHYIGLTLSNTIPGGSGTDTFSGLNWRFWKTYICQPPVEFPIGNGYTICKVKWHAIPYQIPLPPTPGQESYGGQYPELISQGTILYDHETDET